MSSVDIVVGLFVIAIPLVAAAWRFRIPYPVVLVIGGALLGFVPHLPVIHVDPQLIFLVLLPPLLYWEATTAPSGQFRRNRVWIMALTIGLTLATIAAVAAVVQALLPPIGWAVALVLAATVAPTDEAASLPILERLRVPRRVIAIVEGEALLNDAAALIFYAAALGAVAGAGFSPGGAMVQLVVAIVGAAAIGAAVGYGALAVWRVLHDPQLESIVDVAVPFLAYVAADMLHCSGVLAVVIAGLIVNRRSIHVIHPTTRLRMAGFWSTLVFAINALLYILVGTQLHGAIAAVARYPWWTLAALALGVNAAIIVLRVAWIFTQGLVTGNRNAKEQLLIAWSGLRGAISLAAALAVPATIGAGAAFPHRELIIFVTFTVVLVTLVIGGFTLPPAIRAMRLPNDDSQAEEAKRAITGATTAALRRLDDLQRDGSAPPEVARVLRGRYTMRLDTFGTRDGDGLAKQRRLNHLERQLVEAERHALIEMRDRGEIDDDVVRGVQLQLDKDQTRSMQLGQSMIPGSE